MKEIGLVLEGGGMRGVYTAGVLDAFLDHDVHFTDCIAVSAGACNAISYLPGQRTRFYHATTRYLTDARYLGWSNFFRTGSLFGHDFMFNDVANALIPVDYAGFNRSDGNLTVVVTNCVTGQPEYHKIHDLWKERRLIAASSALPLMSPVIYYRGVPYLDGGLSDPIPIRRSILQGHKRNVVILTRDATYRKHKTSLMPLLRLKYAKYPALLRRIAARDLFYNRILDYLTRLEKAGEVFLLRPSVPVKISKFERDENKMAALYNSGIRDAVAALPALRAFLKQGTY